MDTTPPFPDTPDQRLLAAIVFTDVSGFSARVELQERSSLRMLEQDFAVMREFSKELSGTVLKSTGDGLLLYFTSAVHAVTWALKTQRHFAEQARMKPHSEILRHRVGVHVGDVFVRADDVMGDGVNVAARVQAESPPGGICISQTVYDVVKNKMDLHVIRLEPRKLKNIRENVQMYHVLLEAPVKAQVGPVAPPPPRTLEARHQPSRSKSRRVTALLLLLAAIGAGTAMLIKTHFKQERALAEGQATRAELGHLLAEKGKSPPAETQPAPTPAAGTDEVDFARLTTNQPAAASAANQAALQQANALLPGLNAWVMTELARYSRGGPLPFRLLRGLSGERGAYVDRDKQLRIAIAGGGAERASNWADLKADEQGAIIVAALRRPHGPVPREIVRGAEAFAYINGLPEMADELARLRGR